MLPVFCIIYDKDVDVQVALKYPPLYRTLQSGRELNFKTFLIWVWKAVYQGSMILMVTLLLIENSFLKIEVVAFTSLIFTQYAMTLTEVVLII